MSIELEIYCADCGRILDSDFNPVSQHQVVTICVPCSQKIYEDGWKEALDERDSE